MYNILITQEEVVRMGEEHQDKSENQPKGGETDNTANAEDLLKSLKLKDSEIEALKGNENLLNVIAHNLEAKRGANAEAKKYREELAQLQQKLEAEEKAQLEKKGEFEKLYQEANEKLSQKDQRIKEALVKGELSRLAGQYGLAKSEYLKLLDANSIEVDIDSATVNGAEDVFIKFKEDNPELFKQSVPSTDNKQQSLKGSNQSDIDKLKDLENRAKSGLPRDVARYVAFKRELQK